jgi:uncharacterized membrane protein
LSDRRRFSWLRSRPLEDEHELSAELKRDDPLWPGQLAILVAVGIYFLLPAKLTIGPNWIIPAAEVIAGVSLAAATPTRGVAHTGRRRVAIGLVLVATAANLVALGLLTHYLVVGGHAGGEDLITGGVAIWCTNLLLFAVWYWELDRGGPLPPAKGQPAGAPDFLFPQMSDDRFAPPGWKPGFSDYLYVSLTNQTAFSPTDTMPLTSRIKLVMAVQGLASLVTVGVIIARAVNVLN